MVHTKMFEIKIEKSTTSHQLLNGVDSAKCGMKRVRIELTMLDFRKKYCQLTTRAQSGSLFGNERLPCLPPGSPLRLAIGDCTIDRGLSPCRRVVY